MAAAGREGGFRSAPPVVAERSGLPALIEVVFWNRLGLGGIELGALVEVVGEGFPGDLVCLPTAGPQEAHFELGLGWSPGGVEERGRSGLPDVGENLCDGLWVGEEGDEGGSSPE